MDEVLEKASALAAAIQASERYRKLRACEERIAGDEETQALTRDYEAARGAIDEKEKALRPVEVEEKRAFAELEERIKRCEPLVELMRVRADYYEMMNRVNATIQQALS